MQQVLYQEWFVGHVAHRMIHVMGTADVSESIILLLVTKTKLAEEFGKGEFPIFSCTLALRLGQNWKHVKIMVIMGAMDPSESNQMGGQAGRRK